MNRPYIDTFCDNEKHFIHFYEQDKNTDLYFVQLGHQRTLPGYGVGPSIRDHYLIHFVQEGTGTLLLGRQKYSVKAGDCFCIAPNEIAYYESSQTDPMTYYWIGFNGYSALRHISEMGFCTGHCVLPIRYPREIFYEFERIQAIGYHRDNYLAYHAILYYILFYQKKAVNTPTVPSDVYPDMYPDVHADPVPASAGYLPEDTVAQVLKIIQTSYSDNISVAAIARQLSITRNHLSRLFRRETGTTIRDYLLDYRLNKAASLLRDPHRKIGEIAYETGFHDPLYFSRIFKQKYGQSPSQYRRLSTS